MKTSQKLGRLPLYQILQETRSQLFPFEHSRLQKSSLIFHHFLLLDWRNKNQPSQLIMKVSFLYSITTPRKPSTKTQTLRICHATPALPHSTIQFLITRNAFKQEQKGVLLRSICAAVPPNDPCHGNDWGCGRSLHIVSN